MLDHTGKPTRPMTLGVRNMNGCNEEYGFRLYWLDPDGRTAVPALGLNASNPFRLERDAIAYGLRRWSEKAKRVSW